jgi:membrane-associated phospholipid phosphatase
MTINNRRQNKSIPSKWVIILLCLASFCQLAANASAQGNNFEGKQLVFSNIANVGSDSANKSSPRPFLRRATPYIILAAAGGLIFPLDKDINRQFYKSRWHNNAADHFSLAIRKYGMVGPYAIAIPLLAGHGLLYKNRKSLYVAGELTGGILIAGGVTESVKKIFGRERPYQTSSPFRFFKGGSSFYSGHTIFAWTFATILSKNYPRQNLGVIGIHQDIPLVPALAYAAAGLVGVQRLYSHNHWASDVYYGALAGYGVGSLAVYLGNQVCQGRLRLGFDHPGTVQLCYRFN